jgi:hypothetical protein
MLGQELSATLPLWDFAVRAIGENVVMITYVREVKPAGIGLRRRSSPWSRPRIRWQLRFHEGPPVARRACPVPAETGQPA